MIDFQLILRARATCVENVKQIQYSTHISRCHRTLFQIYNEIQRKYMQHIFPLCMWCVCVSVCCCCCLYCIGKPTKMKSKAFHIPFDTWNLEPTKYNTIFHVICCTTYTNMVNAHCIQLILSSQHLSLDIWMKCNAIESVSFVLIAKAFGCSF